MRKHFGPWARSGILASMLLLMNVAAAQSDSLRQPLDSLLQALQPVAVLLLPDLLVAPSTLTTDWFATAPLAYLPLPEDSVAVDSPKGPIYKQVYTVLKEQVPEVYHNDTNQLRLHIPIAWREDIDLPLPKAFEKAGPRPPYDPVMAWQRAALLPGWGQIYNRDYWKLPIFYAGYGGATWWVLYNHNLYQELRIAYRASLTPDFTDDDPRFVNYDSEGIRNLRENFRNRRDQGILILAGWHVVQIAEAYVAAHMEGFDVSKDLSFHPYPTLMPAPSLPVNSAPALGLGFSFQF